jgi:hypothetical protein
MGVLGATMLEIPQAAHRKAPHFSHQIEENERLREPVTGHGVAADENAAHTRSRADLSERRARICRRCVLAPAY